MIKIDDFWLNNNNKLHEIYVNYVNKVLTSYSQKQTLILAMTFIYLYNKVEIIILYNMVALYKAGDLHNWFYYIWSIA